MSQLYKPHPLYLLAEGFPLNQTKFPLCITMPTSPFDSREELLLSIHAHSSCRRVATTRIDTVCRWCVAYRTELTRAKFTPGAWNSIFDISVAQAFPTTNSPSMRLSSASMTGNSICFPKQLRQGKREEYIFEGGKGVEFEGEVR